MPIAEAQKPTELLHYRNKRQKKFFNALNKAIKDGFELFTFDIFDTLITRTTATPSGIFALMQHELEHNPKYNYIDSDFKNNFYYNRIGAENYLNRTKYSSQKKAHIPANEIRQDFSIEEFYELLQFHHNLDSKTIKDLINLELETEYKNSLPLKENIEALKYLISKNKKVVLISDMYLKEEEIRRLLLKHDEIFKNLKIYVSIDYQAKKSNGNLYKFVKDFEKADYKNWFHIGDNKNSDIKQAQNLSIQTFQIDTEKLTEFEENIIDSHYNDPYYQTIIGNAKNTRRFYPDNKKADFATIATTILFPYVRWLINQSLQKGFKRLYFIARDGYILEKIADIIIKQENINIETHYIYGSRDAWRIPCVECFDDLWFWFTYHKTTATVKRLAKMFLIDENELKKYLPKYYKKKKTTLTSNDFLTIYDILKGNPEFIKFITNKNNEQRQLLIEYLKQEIDFSNNEFAFVDLTGSGATLDLLSKQIAKHFNIKTHIFMYRLSTNINYENCKTYSYHQQPIANIVEFLARAPHGQTMEYSKQNNKIVPILSNENVMNDFDEYIKAIEKYAELYSKTFIINNLSNSNMLTHAYLDKIRTEPTKKIAQYFSNISFEEIGTSKKQNKNKITIKEVLDYYFINKKIYYQDIFKMKTMMSPFYIKVMVALFEIMPKTNLTIFKKIKLTLKLIRIMNG